MNQFAHNASARLSLTPGVITSATVLNAEYCGLGEKLPIGHNIDLNAPIVFAIGPNGSGKSSLVRLICSSIRNARFLVERERTRKDFEFDLTDLAPSIHQASLSSNQHLPVGVSFKVDSNLAITSHSISTIPPERLRTLPDTAFRLLKIEVGSELPLIREFEARSPQRKDGTPDVDYTKRRLFSEFDTSFGEDGETENLFWRAQSPGQEARKRIQREVMLIEKFFEEKKFYPNQHLQLRDDDPKDPLFQLLGTSAKKVTDAPHFVLTSPQSLLVVMDEPTAFLDRDMKRVLLSEIRRLAETYAPRLQFLITTNDDLILQNPLPGLTTFVSFWGNGAAVSSEEPYLGTHGGDPWHQAALPTTANRSSAAQNDSR